ncbi:TPA: hypothetical protein O7X39_004497 [Salmonella enterica]|nr:hypothetical protein [Salmonella enterica]
MGTLQPVALEVLKNENEVEQYNRQFHFTDDDGLPYGNTKYVAFFPDGTKQEGETDSEGKTKIFVREKQEGISIHLMT